MTSVLTLTLAVIVTLSGHPATAASSGKPDFCRRYTCPLFAETPQPGFSSRAYAAGETTWAATSVRSSTGELSTAQSRSLISRLFDYISGANDAATAINMTLPLVKQYTRLPSGHYTVTMMFYMVARNPPQPSNPEVFITTLPANVMVRPFRSFGRDAPASAISHNLQQLQAAATRAGMSYSHNTHLVAGYGPRYRPNPDQTKRYDEVWLLPTDNALTRMGGNTAA